MRAPQVAWFYSAAWPDFIPALTCFPQVDADAMVWLYSPHGCHGQPTFASVLG
ncbi:hypothetical protein JOH51_001562 [Rhizobium leguminosarum]|nr:hypothetical protein [Rhizobium leguminosarum]